MSGFLHKQNPKLCRVWGFYYPINHNLVGQHVSHDKRFFMKLLDN